MTTEDLILKKYLMGSSTSNSLGSQMLDLTVPKEIHDVVGRYRGDSERKIENEKYWEAVGNANGQKGYYLPCFITLLLELFPKAAIERNEEGAAKIRDIDLANLNYLQKDLLALLFPLIKVPEIKQRFIEMIQNICSQDRGRMVFNEHTNCSDAMVFNLLFLLTDISEGCFRENFVDKIGINKFPTFCFFAMAQLLSISKIQLINEYKQDNKGFTCMRLIQFGAQRTQKYLDFVYKVIYDRRDEVYKPLQEVIHPVDLYTYPEIIEHSFPDKKAQEVADIIYDSEFLNIIFTIQTFNPSSKSNFQMLFLYSTTLTYKNGLKTSALETLQQVKVIDELAIKRLLRNYTERGEEYVENRRVIINDILKGRVLPIEKDTLRMANALIGDISNTLSNIYIEIKHYDEYLERIEWLRGLELRDEEEELSEEENMPVIQLPHELSVYENMSDDEIEGMLKNEIIEFYMEREETVPLAIRLQNNPVLLEEIVEREMRMIRNKIKMFSSYKTKLKRKRKMKEYVLKMCGKKIESLIFYIKNVLLALESHLLLNRRLFLHKGVFCHCCGVLCYSMGELCNKIQDNGMVRRAGSAVESSNSVRAGNATETSNSARSAQEPAEGFHFEPTELLRACAQCILNIINNNLLLADKAGFDIGILGKALEIIKARYLMGGAEIEDLERIHERIKAPPEQNEMSFDLSDAPENYLDPLTCVLMTHPVQLLTSNVIIDKSTLNQIMLNDRIDPFSRMPLDDTKYTPLPELEAEIQQFIEKKKKQ